MSNSANDIFVTDLPVSSSIRQLNDIGVSEINKALRLVFLKNPRLVKVLE